MATSYSFKEIRVHNEAPAWAAASWQADCGEDHARGESPGLAVAHLVDYLIGKREALNARVKARQFENEKPRK
jgi:hypothetical protein